MANHIGKKDAKSRKDFKRTVSKDWLPVNAQIGEVVNEWSGRRDLVVFTGEGAGRGVAPALYDPKIAEIEVDVSEAFGPAKPKQIGDFTERKTQFEWTKASGYILHEAMHARNTTADLKQISKDLEDTKEAYQSYMLLEESRIEARGVDTWPKNRPFLRASAMTLAKPDPAVMALADPVETAIRMSALVLGRVDAGVLDRDDAREIRKMINKVISADIRKKQRVIWRKFQDMDDRLDLPAMEALAREWVQLARDTREENGKDPDGPQPQGGVSFGNMDGEGENEGEESEGDAGAGQELTEEELKQARAMADAMDQDENQAEHDANKEAAGQEKREEYEERAKGKQAQAKEQSENQKMSKNIFERSTGPNGTQSNSHLVDQRDPKSEERIAATRIGQALEKAKYRDRVRIETSTALPPGRLHVGSAMQGRANVSNGGQNTSEPWRRVQRKRVEDPNLTVGMMCDISGSMGETMQPMAVSAWVMSEAVRRIQGKVASVYYGNDVFTVLKPGEHLKKVNVYTAADGTEAFNKAFMSLDGALNLLYGNGARLLIICSDGNYTTHEETACIKWLRRCKQMGVAVVWLGFKYGRAEEYCKETGHTFVHVGNKVTDAATAIGAACTKALTEAGGRV